MKKTPADSRASMTELVMPNDTNQLDNLMGGNLLRWMDICASISAMRHSSSVCVTVSVDNVSFQEPIRIGDVVTIESRISRAFRTSMEIYLEVFRQRYDSDRPIKCNEAYLTFVALGSDGRPKAVPGLQPKTEADQKLFDSAGRRRELRLILAGKMQPNDSEALKSLFLP